MLADVVTGNKGRFQANVMNDGAECAKENLQATEHAHMLGSDAKASGGAHNPVRGNQQAQVLVFFTAEI